MKQKQPKPVKAWALVSEYGDAGYVCFGYPMYPTRKSARDVGVVGRLIRVEIRPLPAKPRKARRKA